MIQKGDKVYSNNKITADGKYRLNQNDRIKVRDGLIISRPWF
jgi:hypothetical protein